MRKNFTKGFTLIELLVVIAIIGILASIVLVSLNSARGKGRDGQRIANLQEMAKAIALVEPDTSNIGGCANAGKANLCTGGSGTAAFNFSSYADPSVGTGGSVCARGAGTACQYVIFSSTLKMNDYQICTYLENGSATQLSGGNGFMANVSTTTGGGVRAGC